jgi:hypothetical protein
MGYERLGRHDLKKILRCNPPDVPHYQKALEEGKRRSQTSMLVVSCTAIGLTVIAWLPFGRAKTLAPQVKQENWQRVLSTNQQFENYKNDFRQFAQSSHAKRSRNAEDLTDIQLMVVADQIVVHLEYVQTIVAIYLKASSKQDRLAIWPLITDQIDFTRKRLDQQVGVANALITELRTPAVVTEAMRMRDDLRRVEQDLDGAMKEIETAEARLR